MGCWSVSIPQESLAANRWAVDCMAPLPSWKEQQLVLAGTAIPVVINGLFCLQSLSQLAYEMCDLQKRNPTRLSM